MITVLVAQLLYDYILASRLALSTISPMFVDRFGRSLWFWHLEFDKKAMSDGTGVKMPGICKAFLIHFLSYLGPCGSCYLLIFL